MWFKHRAWIPIAWLLSLVNLVAVWFAAQPAEPWHATIHALLAVLFAVGAQRLMARRLAPGTSGQMSLDQSRIDRLQEGIDVIALEVERISEGQRYVTKILNEKLQPSIGAGEARAMGGGHKDAAPMPRPNEER